MPRHILQALSLFLLLTAAGCGGSSGGGGFEPPPPPPPPPQGPPAIELQSAFPQLPGFLSPVLALAAPGDPSRWFVVEQRGTVQVFNNDASVATSSVFVDLTARVDDGPGEAGLLGMAFHPDFASNGYVFLSYTRNLGTLESVIARYTLSGNVLDPSSETILLTVAQPFGNHNGGHIAFGPDGFLYAGFGDGGGAGDPEENGQNTTTLLGSVLRIDVDGGSPYAIPPGNPFAGNTECAGGSGLQPCPEIYAWGFRNPWRWSFDRQTGDLWVGDVGQNLWEEVDRVEAGLNYGWDEREGAHCFEPPTGCSTANVDPITEYSHDLGDRSITGGYVYRGASFTALQGFYLFGDFISGRIWSVAATSAQGTAPDLLLDSPHNISAFAEGEDGELYVVSYAGRLYRVVPAP